jgi:hypothetical protein
VRKTQIVCVVDRNIGAASRSDRLVEGAAASDARSPEVPEARVINCSADLSSAIGGAIVKYHDLDVLAGLRQGCAYRSANEVLGVVSRDDN